MGSIDERLEEVTELATYVMEMGEGLSQSDEISHEEAVIFVEEALGMCIEYLDTVRRASAECSECHKMFVVSGNRKKTCSRACSTERNRRRTRERYRPSEREDKSFWSRL